MSHRVSPGINRRRNRKTNNKDFTPINKYILYEKQELQRIRLIRIRPTIT